MESSARGISLYESHEFLLCISYFGYAHLYCRGTIYLRQWRKRRRSLGREIRWNFAWRRRRVARTKLSQLPYEFDSSKAIKE